MKVRPDMVLQLSGGRGDHLQIAVSTAPDEYFLQMPAIPGNRLHEDCSAGILEGVETSGPDAVNLGGSLEFLFRLTRCFLLQLRLGLADRRGRRRS